MADFSAHAKVGLIVIIAIIMVVGGLKVIQSGVKGQTITVSVVFKEARGLSRGVDVRIAGVVKGNVTGVDYDPDRDAAVLTIKVRKEARFPKDARFVAVSEGMVSQKIINIEVPDGSKAAWAEDGDEFTGVFEDGFDQILVKGNKMLDKLNEMLEQVASKLDTEFLNEVLGELAYGVKDTLDNVNVLLISLDRVVTSNQDEIDSTLKNLMAMSANFNDISARIKEISDDPELARRMDSISAGLESSVLAMERIAGDIEDITGDPQIKKDIKDSVRTTAETITEAREALGELRGTLSGVSDKIEQFSAITDIEISGRVGGRYVQNSDPKTGQDKHQALADVEMQLETKKGFIRVGVDGIGEESQLNLQGGRHLNDDLAFRAGIVRSKVGMGFDYNLGGALWTLNTYDPNDPQVNSYLGYKLSKDYSIKIGVEDALGDANFVAGLAIEF